MGSHSHAHSHEDGWFSFPLDRVGRRLAAALAAVLALTVVGVVLMWPTEEREVPPGLVGSGVERLDVSVTSVDPTECIGAPDSPIQCVAVVFDLPDDGEGSFVLTPSVSTAPIEVGDRIVVADQGTVVEERFRYFFLDFQRDRSLLLLLLLFAGAVVLLARWQGLRSLVALVLSFVVLVGFTLPALLETGSPVWVAIVGSAGVAMVTLLLTHGVNHLTAVALLGSLASLGVTGLFAWIFVEATSLTGLSDENALFLLSVNDQVDLPGVLLAGMIIGTIGVLDDVTVTQAAVVAELHDANPHMSRASIYRRALRVGRDHIGSTVNTLVFAYAGAALPLLLLFTQARLSLDTVLTSEIVAVEVVQALVGGLGLVSSVPITTALAVWVIDGHIHDGGADDGRPSHAAPA